VPSKRPDKEAAAYSAGRIAALPALAVLGVALPLTFPSLLDQYLYYFRPVDLLPIYATAWVILAVLALPFWGVASLALKGLEGTQAAPLPAIAHGLRIALLAAAAAVTIETVFYSLITWLQTFGIHWGDPARAIWMLLAAAVGLLLALAPRGRHLIAKLSIVPLSLALAGALSLASLPVFAWRYDSQLPVSEATSPTAAHASRPNVVLLTIDALSASHMSLYGAARPTTPMLARFAQGATTFDRAYANGNFTTPGVASILTSTRPWTHRALQLPVWPEDSTRRDSLPALLSRSGYQMGYVSTNAHAGASAQGFGGYFQFARTDRTRDLSVCTDGLASLLRYVCAAEEVPMISGLEGFADRMRGGPGNQHYDPLLATRPALAWLRNVDKAKPVFLWVHLFPPHSPYAAPAPWIGRFDPSPNNRTIASTEPHWAYLQSAVPSGEARTLAARYDESVAYVDHYAGEFLQHALELLGSHTIVIVTADHGESFAHGYGGHTGPGLYEEIIHVPLLIKLPGQSVGRRSSILAEQVDIAPTVAEAAGLAVPSSWEGRSLLGACSANAENADAPGQPDKPAFSMNFEQNPRHAALTTGSVAVIDGRWKLVHYMGRLHYPLMPKLHDELYDLVSDPKELKDVAQDEPQEVAHLRGLIDAQLARHGAPMR
jgi:arylsulfatase A-like enzyme